MAMRRLALMPDQLERDRAMIVRAVIIAAIIAERCRDYYETTIRPRGASRCLGRVRSRRLGLWLATLTNLVGGLSIEAAIFPIVSNKRQKDNDMSARSTKRSGTTLLIVLLVTAAPAARVRASNLLGMEHAHLRGVRITMKDGPKLVGYVGWSSEEFKDERKLIFPQSMIDPTAWREETKTLDLYTRLYPVSKKVLRRAFPDGDSRMRMVIATSSDRLSLSIKQIARISALPMRYDGIATTIEGMITDVHSPNMIRLLMSGRPFATFKNDGGHVLVSFNSQIGRRQLAAIDAALTKKLVVIDAERTKLIGSAGDAAFNKAWDQVMRRLQRRGVVSIEFITED